MASKPPAKPLGPDISDGLIAWTTLPGSNDQLHEARVDAGNWTGIQAASLSIQDAKFTHTDITSAKLRESDWLDVVVEQPVMSGANLDGARLQRVAFESGRLTGLILSAAGCKDVSFEGCKLDMANFRQAKLSRVRFKGCELGEADFGSAQLSDVTFEDCDITGTDFSGANMSRVSFESSRLIDIKGISGLSGATLSVSQLMALVPVFAAESGIIIADE